MGPWENSLVIWSLGFLTCLLHLSHVEERNIYKGCKVPTEYRCFKARVVLVRESTCLEDKNGQFQKVSSASTLPDRQHG